jgi:hypothetical protein
VVKQLTNGVNYVFRVAARNAVGQGDFSAISTAVSPYSRASAPLNLNASARDGRVDLTWTIPSSLGSGSLTDYSVQFSANGGTTWTTFNDGTRTATSATVTGLTNGTGYVFRVAAVTSVGPGLWSAASANTVPAGPATAPLTLRGTALDGKVSLTWTNPSSNGGSAIRDYVIESRVAGSGSWSRFNDGVTTATTATVTGLTNGTSYVFRVAAVTGAGQGAWTPDSAAVVPFGQASAPRDVRIVAGDARAVVSWTVPATTGGSPIRDYTVQVSANGGTERFELIGTTGDADTDDAIKKAVTELPSFSQKPPAGMPQPIRLRIITSGS